MCDTRTETMPRSEPYYLRLRLAAKKLGGLSYLIECEGFAEALPENSSDVKWGIGLIMRDIQDEIAEISATLERLDDKGEGSS